MRRRDSPSHGSGSVLAARSSIENLMSLPFSILDSGSALRSQYCRPVGPSTSAALAFAVEAVVDLDFLTGFMGFCSVR